MKCASCYKTNLSGMSLRVSLWVSPPHTFRQGGEIGDISDMEKKLWDPLCYLNVFTQF